MPNRPTRYAAKSTVSIEQTRAHIAKLLRSWECEGVRWTDDWLRGRIALEFVCRFDDRRYLARFTVELPDEKTLQARCRHARTGALLKTRLLRETQNAGRSEMRALLILLKALFQACDDGIIRPAEIFFPWIVTDNGRTIAESALPRLEQITANAADVLQLAERNP